MKKFLFLLLINQFIYSQPSLNNSSNANDLFISPPNPEARGLIKSFKHNVNLASGIPEINYPIVDLVQGDLNLNLSFEYNSSGIKVDEIASNVGLGWRLSGVPKVTRVVKGLPDEFSNGYIYNQTKVEDLRGLSFIGTHVDDIINYTKDYEPDIFYFDLGKLSFQAFWNQGTNKFLTIPESSIIISFEKDNIGISKWHVIDEDGVNYYFGTSYDNQRISRESFSEPIISQIGLTNSIVQNNAPHGIGSWNILDIISTTNNQIKFKYDSTTNGSEVSDIINSNDRLILNAPGFSGTLLHCDPKTKGTTISTRSYLENRLLNIESKNISVNFNYDNTPREDLGINKITSVDIQNLTGNIKRIELNHSYSISPAIPNYNGLFQSDKRKKRLMLNSISEVSSLNEKLTTSYIYNTTLLPPRFSFMQDLWGYYNGVSSNNSFVPAVIYSNKKFGSADKSVNINYSKAQTLEKILLATGGSIVFDYESNGVRKSEVMTEKNLDYLTNKLLVKVESFAKNINYKVANTDDYRRIINLPESMAGDIKIVSNTNGCPVSNNLNLACAFTIRVKGLDPSNNHINYSYQNTNTTQIDGYLPPGNYELYATFNEGLGTNPNPDFSFYIQYNYEANDSDINDLLVGGLRIKNIKYFNENGLLKQEESYNYNNFSNDVNYNRNEITPTPSVSLTSQSSGFMATFPSFFNISFMNCAPDIILYGEATSSPLNDLQNVGATHILYTNVRKNVMNGSNQIKEEYFYRKQFKNPVLSSSCESTLGMYNNYFIIENLLPSTTINFGGELLSRKIFDNQTLIYEENNTYEEIPLNNENLIYSFGFKGEKFALIANDIEPPMQTVFNPYYTWCFYSFYNKVVQLKRKQIIEYENSKPLETVQLFDYDLKNKLIKQTTTSNLNSTISEISYPYSNGITNYNNLLEKNILNIPIQSKEYINNEQQTNTLLLYNVNVNQVKPNKYITYHSENDENPDVIEVKKYDSYGNPTEIWYKDGSKKTIIWGYHDSYPIVEINNELIDNIDNSLITQIRNASNNYDNVLMKSLFANLRNIHSEIKLVTFTFKPGVGLESKTDESNNELVFKYDAFNRLYETYLNGKLTKRTNYKYAN